MNKAPMDADFAASGSIAPDASQADHLAEVKELAKDPAAIDEFLEAARSATRVADKDELSDLLISTLLKFKSIEEDDKFRNHCNFDCHSDKFACFMLENREMVVAANHLARERFDIKAATHADDLDLIGINGEPFAQVVIKALQSQPEGSKTTPIAQAFSKSLKRRLDVAVLHIHVCALMGITKELILISDAITPTTLDLFAQKFDLTPTEANIVHRFSSGQSIQEIATHRCRSLATVKTQFYKILEKCGAASQGELLQMVARIESLTAATSSINEEFSHPHRRIFNLMRPGNRTLDVVSAGKPDGRPVLSCNSLTFRTFPPWLEEELYQNNLKLYSVAPPGSGNTSPPLEGQSIEDCMAQDLTSLLENIGVGSAVLIGTGTSLPLCLRTAQRVPERIEAVFSFNALAPSGRILDQDWKADWIPGMRHLTLGTQKTQDEDIAGAFFRVVNRLGVARSMQLALSKDGAARALFQRSDHFASFKDAYDSSMAQGVEHNTAAFKNSLVEDWEDDLKTCPVPVHFAIGERDRIAPFDAIEELAADHSAHVTFTRIPDAGAFSPLNNHKAFFAALNSAVGGN